MSKNESTEFHITGMAKPRSMFTGGDRGPTSGNQNQNANSSCKDISANQYQLISVLCHKTH